MSIVDLHPEDLIDKLARGELSKPEQERLRAHFAVCDVCRFEHTARQNFDVAFRAVKTLHDPSFLASGAIERLFSPAAIDGPHRKSPPASSRPRVSHLVSAIAVALMITSAAAGAGIWPRLRPLFSRTTRLEPLSSAHTLASPVGRAPISRPSIDGAELEQKSDSSASPIAPSMDGSESGQPFIREVRGFGSTVATPSASPSSPLRRETPRGEPLPMGSAPGPQGATAMSLFSGANTARRHGDEAVAVQLYRELQRRFPESSEAHVSRATLGRLLLDGGDPRTALIEFRQYLSTGGGELEEEALVGKALALQNLGRRDAEVVGWKDVLEKHPKSIYCEQARARLSALSGP